MLLEAPAQAGVHVAVIVDDVSIPVPIGPFRVPLVKGIPDLGKIRPGDDPDAPFVAGVNDSLQGIAVEIIALGVEIQLGIIAGTDARGDRDGGKGT